MTINQVIKSVDAIKPNSFDVLTKADIINNFEWTLYFEVFDEKGRAPYDNSLECLDSPLYLKPPYDKVYEYYLSCMVDYLNEDFESYSVCQTMFNTLYDDFKDYYIRKNARKASSFRNIL